MLDLGSEYSEDGGTGFAGKVTGLVLDVSEDLVVTAVSVCALGIGVDDFIVCIIGVGEGALSIPLVRRVVDTAVGFG